MKASKEMRDKDRYDTLCDVNMSCMAAVDILNDLLCYEKLDSGILTLHKEDITIGPFLNDSVSMFAAQAREGGVTISVITDAGIAINSDMITCLSLQEHDSIFVDKFKMDQVIRNLISNALKFTPRGGSINISAKFVFSVGSQKTLNVSSVDGPGFIGSKSFIGMFDDFCRKGRRATAIVTPVYVDDTNPEICPVDGYLVLVVTDTGAGISMENQKRLFKDIVQFNPEKLQAGGGSGLGLWISGGIVDLHDGKISVYSEGEGMGSSFTVEIPMLRLPLSTYTQEQKDCNDSDDIAHAIRRAHPTDDRKPDPLQYEESLLTTVSPSYAASSTCPLLKLEDAVYDILIVDDSRLNRKMLMKFFNKDGHRCTEAEDGLEAIERVKERIDSSNGGHGSPFDAILMDFIMPNMDGPTATRQLRTMGYTSVIFGVTGNGKKSL